MLKATHVVLTSMYDNVNMVGHRISVPVGYNPGSTEEHEMVLSTGRRMSRRLTLGKGEAFKLCLADLKQ